MKSRRINSRMRKEEGGYYIDKPFFFLAKVRALSRSSIYSNMFFDRIEKFDYSQTKFLRNERKQTMMESFSG